MAHSECWHIKYNYVMYTFTFLFLLRSSKGWKTLTSNLWGHKDINKTADSLSKEVTEWLNYFMTQWMNACLTKWKCDWTFSFKPHSQYSMYLRSVNETTWSQKGLCVFKRDADWEAGLVQHCTEVAKTELLCHTKKPWAWVQHAAGNVCAH